MDGRDASVGFVKALGAVELLASAGLILPAALEIAPVLVPLAAAGGVTDGWRGGHAPSPSRGHARHAGPGISLHGRLRGAWGRFGPESFTG
jgi:hypothetical protein